MEIPVNNSTRDNERANSLKDQIIKLLEKDDEVYIYYRGTNWPLDIVKKVLREFKSKGYHCYITYFSCSNAPYQKFVVSKNSMSFGDGRMVYTEEV